MGKKRGRRPSPRRVKEAGVSREEEGGLPVPLDDQRGPVARRASVLVETGQEAIKDTIQSVAAAAAAVNDVWISPQFNFTYSSVDI